MKIRMKLILTMTVLTCIILFTGLYSYFNNLSTHHAYGSLLGVQELRFQVKSIQFKLTGISNDERGYLLQGTPSYIDEMKKKKAEVQDLLAQIKDAQGMDDQTLQTISKIEANYGVFSAAGDKVLKAYDGGKRDDAVKIHFGEERDARKELDPIITDMLAKLDAQTKQHVADRTKRDAILIFSILAVSVALSVGAGIAVFRSITRPLGVLEKRIREIAHGDLSGDLIEVNNRDEIGLVIESANKMAIDLRGVIGQITASAQNVSAASLQISATTEEIAGGSTAQAAAAQTMNELFRELSSAVHSVAEHAEQAAELSGRTVQVAIDGGKLLSGSIQEMNGVSAQMSKLQQDSNQIGEIIEVIDDIAEQTNLLALNAAIEAARAGDQGKGFAVVADEVRKLAERSGEATKQITRIIRGIQENTRQSVAAVQEGVTSSIRTSEAFDRIVAMVGESAAKVTEIAAASEEQAAQASEVLRSVDSIASTSEESAAAAEETAATSQSLARLAETLNSAVANFKLKRSA
ncbi:HAMP domain-containing methyl-accepting chemotaxis protein [Cohnella candidum]|uniref:Methyl-accepting chemotaxis protein n=1 Tax=Cohnella candidum TaxID=2674991 RepID=A0A3G3JSI5_9BACL|nr:methyl-accepting chemotaxis protein [Cohnella candidum]AYQ71185.1 methyl-accepting chemotaxis protein [Cohnella candidum]